MIGIVPEFKALNQRSSSIQLVEVEIRDGWLLYQDACTRGHFEGLTSGDLESWESMDAKLSFPRGTRHGTAFAVPRVVLEGL